MTAAIFLALLAIACVLLALVDIRHGIIPNWLNLAIAVAGLARAFLSGASAGVFSAGCEGVAIGAVAWLLRWLFFRLRGYQGLGLGDVKLLVASGVWIGIAGVPVQLLVASLTALAAAGILQFSGHRMTRQTALPFGPFLALGLFVALTFQQAGMMN